jgi:hypothetical protein
MDDPWLLADCGAQIAARLTILKKQNPKGETS